MKRRYVMTFLVLGMAGVALAGDVPSVPVTLAKPEHRDITRWIRIPGTVDADAEVTLYAKVTGFLKDFKSDIGDRVKPGDLLGHLDVPELEQEVKLAEAQLAAAQADLQTASAQLEQTHAHGHEIDARETVLESGLVKSKAKAEGRRKDYERTQKLYEGNAATEREREWQEYDRQALDAAVKENENQIASIKPERAFWKKDVEVKEALVEAAKSKVGIAQATLDRAKVWRAYTELVVPQIGMHAGATAVITKRSVNNGDLIPGGTGARIPIVTVAVIDPVRVVADVPESDCMCMDAGTPVLISLFALSKEKPIAAKVSRSSNSLSPSSRTLRLEIDVPNAEMRIKPGMMANVELATEVHKGVIAVPSACVVTDKQGSSVFTVESGKAKKIPVETGFQDHGWTEVRGTNVSETTSLIKDVPAAIADGVPVEVKQ